MAVVYERVAENQTLIKAYSDKGYMIQQDVSTVDYNVYEPSVYGWDEVSQ